MLHTATVLQSGKVLVSGGIDAPRNPAASVEIFDPLGGTWSSTSPMTYQRAAHAAVRLPNGRVLVVSGTSMPSATEIYDPLAGGRASTGALVHPGLFLPTLTLLPNGKVLVRGVAGTTYVTELFDPATGLWSSAGTPTEPRYFHTATLLSNGLVLVTGGIRPSPNPMVPQTTIASAELYDPSTNSWTTTGSLNVGREMHTATRMTDGRVLVTGGVAPYGTVIGASEIYEPTSQTWTSTSASIQGFHQAVLLTDGTVLVAGGGGMGAMGSPSSSAFIFRPTANTWNVTRSLVTPRDSATLLRLNSGSALIIGGRSDDGGFTATAEIY